MTRFFALVFALCLGAPLHAACEGPAAFDALSDAERTVLEDRAGRAPFSEGILWQVERDGVVSVIVGTLHIPASGHGDIIERLDTLPVPPQHVFLEITSEDEKAMLRYILARPELFLITEGPSLIDRLGDELWNSLKPRLAEIGLPAFMAAKYQPWFLGLSLSVPSCAAAELRAGKVGLDRQIETWAAGANLPAQSLDDFENLISLLASDPLAEQIDTLKWSLALGIDTFGTGDIPEMVSLYFREKIQLIWERVLSKALARAHTQTDAERIAELLQEMQRELIEGRNTAWIEILAPALSRAPSLVAVGAMHLPGEMGVLAQLQNHGFSVTRLSLTPD